ncbi:putative F-box protein [Cinnamomum micranthum f. kanehirae]|uniref:Putative F-box protein n=1 Tax=Cinnamomum micranthum f. kanehirae TaxID=337451 RepID=A0A3S3MB83_9MAGN|nr:putative F-box protein [Cinnamomum micranthum f. kanehirae]
MKSTKIEERERGEEKKEKKEKKKKKGRVAAHCSLPLASLQMTLLLLFLLHMLGKLWSDLLQCLLELILERLILSDRLRFGSVCRCWRTAQVQCLYPPASQIPFLIFRRNSSTEKRSIEFFSLSEKRIYEVPMPDSGTPMQCIRCVSSSHGWLLFRTLDGKKSGFLFNPFNRKFIQLPDETSFRPFYDGTPFFCNPITLPSGNFGIDFSGIFFSTPTNPNGVLYIKGCHRFMLCALKYLPQHGKWIPYLANMVDAVSNTIFCGGKLYALKDDSTLAVIDSLSPHNITNVKTRNRVYNWMASLRRDVKDFKYILVESCGEILLVIIHGENCWFLSKRILFLGVFRADLTQMQWQMDIGVLRNSVVMLVVPGPDTNPITPAGPAAPPAAVDETAPVPPRGLIEWNRRDTI